MVAPQDLQHTLSPNSSLLNSASLPQNGHLFKFSVISSHLSISILNKSSNGLVIIAKASSVLSVTSTEVPSSFRITNFHWSNTPNISAYSLNALRYIGDIVL